MCNCANGSAGSKVPDMSRRSHQPWRTTASNEIPHVTDPIAATSQACLRQGAGKGCPTILQVQSLAGIVMVARSETACFWVPCWLASFWLAVLLRTPFSRKHGPSVVRSLLNAQSDKPLSRAAIFAQNRATPQRLSLWHGLDQSGSLVFPQRLPGRHFRPRRRRSATALQVLRAGLVCRTTNHYARLPAWGNAASPDHQLLDRGGRQMRSWSKSGARRPE